MREKGSAKQACVLNYEPVKRRRALPWKRIAKWSLGAVLLTGIVLVVRWNVVHVRRYQEGMRRYQAAKANLDRQFQQCLTYEFPEGTIVFGWNSRETPGAALLGALRSLATDRPSRLWPSLARIPHKEFTIPLSPACWAEYWYLPRPSHVPRLSLEYSEYGRPMEGVRGFNAIDMVAGESKDDYCQSTVYVHQRKSPAGLVRFVRVAFDGPAMAFGWEDSFRIQTAPTQAPEEAVQRCKRIACPGFADVARSPLVIYAGRTDPLDASRFTIPFTSGATAYTIEGVLMDDDTVRLRLLPEGSEAVSRPSTRSSAIPVR